MGVHVGRWVVRGVVAGGGVVVDGAGVLVGDEGGVLEEVEVLVDLLDEELVLDEDVEELLDVLEEEGSSSVVLSSTGRSSTGGGSAGAAATRKPTKTRRGTQSMTARRSPSRPVRRRFMAASRLGTQG
ncbi:MAG TPA: hypothetical protein H9805_03470 [Candidatus Janibacter merdipullorum]|nr:hypothetical protein [Candidatus Janibacter merdipullorum]